MISDDERREVACKLRELETGVIGTVIPTGELSKNILDVIEYGHSGAMTPYGLLANLIEPKPERTCRDTDNMQDAIECSECGEITRDTLFWVDVDGGKTVKGHRPRFCSNCGAKVVGND